MSKLAEATQKIVGLLGEFESEERLRIVRASLTLLGDDFVAPNRAHQDGGRVGVNEADSNEPHGTHALALQWMRKNNVTSEQLEHYFHYDHGKFIPIALPGSAISKSEQTMNAYLTQGLASLLATGEAAFTDADARKLCEGSGCYDSTNHSKNLKGLKNRVSGSKSAGWKLTAPGLTSIAELIKQGNG